MPSNVFELLSNDDLRRFAGLTIAVSLATKEISHVARNRTEMQSWLSEQIGEYATVCLPSLELMEEKETAE